MLVIDVMGRISFGGEPSMLFSTMSFAFVSGGPPIIPCKGKEVLVILDRLGGQGTTNNPSLIEKCMQLIFL